MQEEEQEQRRNVIIFFAISLVIMLGYPYFFKTSNRPAPQAMIEQNVTSAVANTETYKSLAKIPDPKKVETIVIKAPRISGTISTQGVKFNNVILNDYKQKYDNDEKVSVFGKENYFAFSGWASEDPSVILPDENSCWEADQTQLTPSTPVVLTWDNGNGLLFTKEISVDENFVFTISDRVKNYGSDPVKLKSVTKIHREHADSSETIGFYNGPIGYFDKKLNEVEYSDIEKKGNISYQTKGGWFGITDKYWLVSFVPEQNSCCNVFYKYEPNGDKKAYTIEGQEDFSVIPPSAEFAKTHNLFVGAKEIKTLDAYEIKLNVPHFDLVIDFGYLYILTKPLLYAMSYVKDLVGNMGFGILLITLLLKLLLFPLANKSYRSMNRMKAIQPKVKALQDKYAGDQARLGQAITELYKKEKVNPVGGCLPIFLQWPILFALYKVLYISIEMRQAPFIGWIHDLSIADPCAVLTLGGLIPVELPQFLQIGIWPLLMGVSMWIQQKMGPAVADPTQAKMMMIMPIMFTFMFAQLPSGLVIYWTFSNLFSIVQQYIITKKDESEAKAQKAKAS